MSFYDMLSLYKGTNMVAPIAKGIKGKFSNSDLDCDCVDCDESADCTNCDSPGTTH